MRDENKTESTASAAEARRGARVRLIALLGVSMIALGVAFSCQNSRENAPGAAAPSNGGGGAASAPTATEASAQTALALTAARTSATQPVGTDPNGRPLTREMKEAGFTFAAAPAQEEGRDERQPPEVVARQNATCVACHTPYRPDAVKSDTTGVADTDTFHARSVGVACIDCHGGHVSVPGLPANPDPHDPNYEKWKHAAHVRPTQPDLWPKDSARNPEIMFAKSMQESADYIRFVNPGALRAATAACAPCHREQVDKVGTSIMTHGALLWEAAFYNNGDTDRKNAIYGEFYGPSADNPSVAVQGARFENPPPTTVQMDKYGIVPALYPLPRWEITQPGNILRVFERGGRFRPIIGEPDREEEAGRPDVKLSLRGYGTDVRTDPVFIGLQKTRLLDPTLNTWGTNDHPGDYRSGGCSGCHVVYGNDRSQLHSSYWAGFGNLGQSFSADPTVNPSSKASTQPAATTPVEDPWTHVSDRERGHPIKHVMVRNMPTSSCIVCHVHPGTNVLNSYLGLMWWDNETDGALMYPKTQINPTSDDDHAVSEHNPEGSAVRGLWSDHYPNLVNHKGEKAGENFLEKLGTPAFNSQLKHTQFADFHGHGWVFRGVYKQDRHGHMLDYAGKPVATNDQQKLTESMGESMKFFSSKPGEHPPAGAPVHLKDIHLERGMQCVDCHFESDNHGNGHLYGATRDAVSITCEDCHGSIEEPSAVLQYLKSSNKNGAQAKALLRRAFSGNATRGLPDDKLIQASRDAIAAHFQIKGGKLYQKSAMYESGQKQNVSNDDLTKNKVPQGWDVIQTSDTNSADYSAPGASDDASRKNLARYAHTVRKFDPDKPGGFAWGGNPAVDAVRGKDGKPVPVNMELAHSSKTVSCYACHSSWNTSCFGCHLPQRANQRKEMLHNEQTITRNYTNYNYQTLRDDVYMLGIDSTTKDHKVVPIRSACAVLVSSQDAQRQWIYTQQQTVSAEGFAGTAFSPYFPHTVRATETKTCADCHIHRDKDGHVDNNAIMAQLLLQGTNSVNFIGQFAWVAEGEGGLEAVRVTERSEPQAVIGSTLHQLAYPDDFKKHEANGKKLTVAHEHSGTVYDLQLRGEYLYAACGEDGFIAYDVANVDNKGFSERISLAPVGPLGQRFYVRSKFATAICSPSTMALDPTRPHLKLKQELINPDGSRTTRTYEPNEEQNVNLLYAFLYMTDKEEGLIVIGNPLDSPNKAGVATLLDGDPTNNFLQRAVTFNPGNALKGARSITLYGALAYVACDSGLVVVDLSNPLQPHIVSTPQLASLRSPRKVQFQFRYGFVCDADGVKVLDMTFPDRPQIVQAANGRPVTVPIADARDIYIARTYGYVAAGKQGLVILDLEKPEAPRKMRAPDDFPRDFNADYNITDANCVRVGMTNASMFAYVADGHNGLKVLQLTSPEYTPTYGGFAPRIEPRLVSWHHTEGPALAISEGLDRDRAVDEAGNQLSVFGRRGARPFNLAEQQRMYLRLTPKGAQEIWSPPNEPVDALKLPEPKVTETPAAAPAEAEPTRPGPRRPPRPGAR